MNGILYFTILCLVYTVSELSIKKWIDPEYWFLSGWIIGISVAIAFNAVMSIVKLNEETPND